MEIDKDEQVQTQVGVFGRRKPRPRHLSEEMIDFMNEVTLESFGKLLESTGSPPSTDKVDVPGDLVVTFIDIGQGNCTFIQCPGGESILVDCGSVTKGPPRLEIAGLASAYIKSRLTNNTLDYLVISHPDIDHMNIVDKVLGGVTVGKLLCGGADEEAYGGKGKNQGRDFLKEKAGGNLGAALINGGRFYMELPETEAKDRYIQCKQGLDVWVVCANAPVKTSTEFKETLLTAKGETFGGTDENTACIVLALRYQERQILICGDATFSTEYAILNSTWADHLQSDALEGGHHGSSGSFSRGFLQKVNPSWLHFSADNKGNFRHPTWEVVSRVLECCPNVVGTAEYGPHGIVHGPEMEVGLEQEQKGEEFIKMTPRVAAVLGHMKEKGVNGKAALDALLPVWHKQGEWKPQEKEPPDPIKEQWVMTLLDECVYLDTTDNDLVTYWGDRFDALAEEQKRVEALEGTLDSYKYYWDWAVLDFNLFTTLTTANLGVYWIITVTPDGDLTTDLA